MSELKACPFCGRIPTRDHWAIYCELCWAEKGNLNEAEWNTRPLEDALLARAEAADADANRLAKLLIQQQNRVKQAESMVERLINVGNQMVHSRTAILTAATLREAWNEDVAEWRSRESEE